MSNVLVLSWFHEQPDPTDNTGPRRYHDPVWTALDQELSVSNDGGNYTRGLNDVLPALHVRRLVLNDQDAYFRIQPREVNGQWKWGTFHRTADDNVTVFRSDRRVGTDGPTLPALDMLGRVLADQKPTLVISVGLGGGVRAEQQIGDVVVSGRGHFDLRGDLSSSEHNDNTFGTDAAIPAGDWAATLRFDRLREPALLGASPSFQQPVGGWPQPAAHQPTVRVERTLPVITRPAVGADMFIPAFTRAQRNNPYLGDTAAAVDCDTAAAAKACQDANVPFIAVIGLAAPVLEPMADDYENALRDAWTEAFMFDYSAAAATNAARTVHRICALTQPA